MLGYLSLLLNHFLGMSVAVKMARRNAKITSSNDRVPPTFEASGQAPAPKHVALPKMPPESELVFEGQTMLLFLVAMVTQYLNLYRTVWWLTQSHTHTAMNFHLIDLNVVHFNVIFMGRSFFQQLIITMSTLVPTSLKSSYIYSTSLCVHFLCTWSLIKSILYIYTNHGITGIMCIGYPLIIYVLMYFSNLLASYEEYRIFDRSKCIKFVKSLTRTKANLLISTSAPSHICSNVTSSIREEVDRLKSSFNERLKFILFRSLLIAYYSSFVPLCLTQPALHYDVTFTAQHVAITWLSGFLMLTSHLYSPQFYDVLHKSALHLGKWVKLETRNTLVPCTIYSDSLLYAQGVVVKSGREYFKAEGIANCAEPGNQSHLRYYIVFSHPVGGFGTLLGLLMILILSQLTLLIRSYEWYKLISMSLLIVVNTLTIFRLVKSYYVLKEVYKVEQQLQDTSHLHNN